MDRNGRAKTGARDVTPLRDVPSQRLGRLVLRDLPLPAKKFGVSLVHERLPAHSETPPIYHKSTEEAVFVLKGRAVIFINDKRLSVVAGDTLHIPAGAVHGVVTAKDSVEVISLFSPAMDPRRPDAHFREKPASPVRIKKSGEKRKNKNA